MSKTRGPSTDRWGTPRVNSDQLLKLKLTLFSANDYLSNFLLVLKTLENPWACSLAIWKSWLKMSKAFARSISTAPP